MAVILNIGIILSFFLGFLLFAKKNKTLSDKILVGWLNIIGLHLLSYFLYYQGLWDKYPHLIGITVPFPFFHGPLLYLYVLYSLKSTRKPRLVDYLHFLPVALSYLYLAPFYFLYTVEEKILLDKGLIDDYSLFANLLLIAFVLSGFSYVIVSYKKLTQRKKILDNNFSNNERINLSWLRNSIISIGGVFLLVAIISILREVLKFQFPFNADIIFYTLVVIYVVYIGFSGIRQQDIFSDNIKDEQQLATTKAEGEYKKSGLKENVALLKHEELTELMKAEKPFLNPKLTLKGLAEMLSLSSNHLSQLINQYEKVNFHDFVNRYRVNEFIERATSDSNNYSLLTHALDSGFNSKSSFNSVFKKIMHTTPSQYIANSKK